MMKRQWLFVGGIARSGTTLMARLLTLHPEGFVTAECGYPLALWWGLTMPPAGYTFAHWQGAGQEASTPWILPRLRQYDDPAEVVRAMCEGYIERLHPTVRVCGDKTPMLGALHPRRDGRRVWEDLRLLWPDCKLLWMDRPLEEAIASGLRVWPHRKEADQRADALERLDGQRLCADALWVPLADLNARPREVLGEVLNWVGLPQAAYPWDEALKYFEPGHRVN